MYYRGVNRGVLTTVPGRYSIALIFGLGLIAIGSGFNAIYLSLSLGIAILIISGVLSERVMKRFEVAGVSPAVGDAGAPVTLELRVLNHSQNQALYGVDCLVFAEPPKFRWMVGEPKGLARAHCLVLEPGSAVTLSATLSGLARGHYRRLFVVDRTLYPFGLLSKFKVSEQATDVVILPPRDEDLHRTLVESLKRRLARAELEREFYCHRPFRFRDPVRVVDWKKSSGKAPSEWVVKQYESPADEGRIQIEVPTGYLTVLSNAEVYEQRLRYLRTVVETVGAAGLPYLVLWEGVALSVETQRLLGHLAALPAFGAPPGVGLPPGRREEARPGEAVLRMDEKGAHWVAGEVPR